MRLGSVLGYAEEESGKTLKGKVCKNVLFNGSIFQFSSVLFHLDLACSILFYSDLYFLLHLILIYYILACRVVAMQRPRDGLMC
jgi:hypothetical protein